GRELEVDLFDGDAAFVSLLIEGRSHEAGLEKRAGGYTVVLADDVIGVDLADAAGGEPPALKKAATGPQQIKAPMPGKVVRVLVGPGDEVAAGAGLVVVEAMKMENELRAPRAGRVLEAAVREGQTVETGALLVVLE
ncbi:MAG TPA: biotin/lipoyl-containing protein, partial [Vicinamibacteria bacterium]